MYRNQRKQESDERGGMVLQVLTGLSGLMEFLRLRWHGKIIFRNYSEEDGF